MAVPKRKTSKARSRKRKTHWKAASPTVENCPNCGESKLNHRVCPNCGQYKNTQIYEVKE